MSNHTTAVVKRWRGVILELVYNGHRNQESRLDYLMLWGLMQDLGHNLGQNDVLAQLQDLQERGYLSFQCRKDKSTNAMRIWEIMITPAGRDLVERTRKEDPAVHIL